MNNRLNAKVDLVTNMKTLVKSIGSRMTIAAVAAIALLPSPITAQEAATATIHYINGRRADAPIPRPGMTLAKGRVAVVITDPQNDFLSTNGVAWGVFGPSVTENKTVENIDSLFKSAKRA